MTVSVCGAKVVFSSDAYQRPADVANKIARLPVRLWYVMGLRPGPPVGTRGSGFSLDSAGAVQYGITG